MKKVASLGRSLSRDEMKHVLGGDAIEDNSCNVYCGDGANYTCNKVCLSCEDAGNGSNPNKPGGDKMCFR